MNHQFAPHGEIVNTDLENILELEERQIEEVETNIFISNLPQMLGLRQA